MEISAYSYAPILSLSPAEMTALEELPDKTKDRLLPIILLKPWSSAINLQSSLDRIEKSIGKKRPFILDIDPNYGITDKRRNVHDQLDELVVEENGYKNWASFIQGLDFDQVIPCLQLHAPSQLSAQINRLEGRLYAVRVIPAIHSPIEPLLLAIKQTKTNPIFIIDYGQNNRELTNLSASTIGLIKSIENHFPTSEISISATTFPNNFEGLTNQQIFERQFFQLVSSQFPNKGIIYSDRGSARAMRQNGGGGVPYPRIDYPIQDYWYFFRKVIPILNDKKSGLSKEERQKIKQDGYHKAAQEVMSSEHWSSEFAIWGTQMIEKTALKDPDGIISPARSTAVRINIHLHLQSLYGHSTREIQDTDDEWTDDL